MVANDCCLGVIYIDGLRKITQLPMVKTGDVVVFESVEVKGGKVCFSLGFKSKELFSCYIIKNKKNR